jgi:hypothetical protein
MTGEETMATELWSDPRTGRRARRQSLGYVLFGRLIVQTCDRSSGIDLLFTGSNLPLLLSPELRNLIDVSWKRLELLGRRRLPKPRPVPVTGRLNTWWLARLVPGSYTIEERSDGGSELFEVLPGRGGARIILDHPRYSRLRISAREKPEIHPLDRRGKYR